MARLHLAYASLLLTLVAVPAFAQGITPTNPTTSTGASVATDAGQQQQINNGLKAGDLSTRESGQLEHGEQRIDRTQARDLKEDGGSGLTAQQQQHIDNMQNHEENRINRDDSNNVHGNPNSASSQRMQKDTQRDANQETRIENGVNNGTMTNKELGRAEHGQAHDDRAEAHAARNGHVDASEQARIQNKENTHSQTIYREKHNGQNTSTVSSTPPAPAAQAAPAAQ